MPVHGVLVERNQDVELVTHAADGAVAGANGQKRVSAADDGLIGVVGVQIEAAPREDACQNVARGGDALPRFAADPDCKIYSSHIQLCSCPSRALRLAINGAALERLSD